MYINKHVIIIVFLLIPEIGFSTIIHVPADEPTIQSGINAAGDGDTILIADGIYTGFGNFDITWNATYKHLVIMSVNGPTNCIIDCQGNGRGFILNWEHNTNDVINGLTITNGWANTSLVGGGAILIKSASPQIINCILVDNSAGNDYILADGGAIDCIKKSSPIIKGNIISNNSATHTGGGIHFADSSSGVVENNIIDNNKSGGCYGGGGMALVGLSNPLVINNLIINNSSWYYSEGGYGGGIITMNSAPKIINNTIANNTTLNGSKLGEGGGIRVRGLPSPIIRNCILWNNIARDTLENIAETYFLKRTPPSIFQPAWEDRLEYLKGLIRDYSIDGVIWYQLSFEEIYDMECSIVSKAMDEMKMPFLKLESSFEYSREAMGPLSTRVESFIQSIKTKRSN